MKKKFLAILLCLVTLTALFAFGGCRNKNGGDDGNNDLPDPAPVDGLTYLAGTWRIDELHAMPSGDVVPPPTFTTDFENYRLKIAADGSFTLTGYDGQKDFIYQGTAENAQTLYYYSFTCTMDDDTVRAQAYLYPEYNKLSFSSIAFENGTTNYMSCICVRVEL